MPDDCCLNWSSFKIITNTLLLILQSQVFRLKIRADALSMTAESICRVKLKQHILMNTVLKSTLIVGLKMCAEAGGLSEAELAERPQILVLRA